MKSLRIVLTQSKAHYKKEETVENKMTYPLPPFSTVIGALHSACGFREYKPMDLSIQGSYNVLSKQAYTDYCFLDRLEDDRDILVKLLEDKLQSKAFVKVAAKKKDKGNSFRKGITIDVFDKDLIDEYRYLKDLKVEIQDFKKKRINKLRQLFKTRKKALKEKKKSFDRKTDEFNKILKREEEIKLKEKLINDKLKEFEFHNYTKHIAKYKSLTTSLKYYEILHEVKLIIHVKAEEDILNTINENIYNLKSIGRSEDFVDVEECEPVELTEVIEDEVTSKYSAYLNYDLVKDKHILLNKKSLGIPASGTKYWINKVYNRDKGYRVFEKVKVVYASNYYIDEESKNVFFDKEGNYIVNFN